MNPADIRHPVHRLICDSIDCICARSGRNADVISAVPDADPGCHTSLSLIDFLRIQPHLFGRTFK